MHTKRRVGQIEIEIKLSCLYDTRMLMYSMQSR